MPSVRRLVHSISVAVLLPRIAPIQAFQHSVLVSRRYSFHRRRGANHRVSAVLSQNDTITPVVLPPQAIPMEESSILNCFSAEELETPLGQPTPAAAKTSTFSRASNPVEPISSINGLTNFMFGGQDGNDLTVVKYYAHYCKICQRAGIQFQKIATEHPNVRFGRVESMVIPDSANTLRSLGVTKFPFVQIYRRGQCVASFSTGPSHLFAKKVRDTIAICLNRTPEEWDAFTTEFSSEIESNREARESLASRS